MKVTSQGTCFHPIRWLENIVVKHGWLKVDGVRVFVQIEVCHKEKGGFTILS